MNRNAARNFKRRGGGGGGGVNVRFWIGWSLLAATTLIEIMLK